MRTFLHFVGFKDERVHSAIKVFGKPDVWHRMWDYRAVSEIGPGDTVVFADGDETWTPTPYTWDDSSRF